MQQDDRWPLFLRHCTLNLCDIQTSQKALEGQILNKVSLTPRAGYGIKCTNIQILLKHSQLVSPLFGCNCTALVKK